MVRSEQIRLLTNDDRAYIEHLLYTSEYVYQRFTYEELSMLLKHYPTLGVFHGNTLVSFLLSQTIHAPSAWIGGFGVSWAESRAYSRFLKTLLEHLEPHLIVRGVRQLHYSGNDTENDWLRDALLGFGFTPYRKLYAYDKFDFTVPARGNQQITIRPVRGTDIPVLLKLEKICFEDLWRYDTLSFQDIATTHPYFVVAELDGQVIGYQFNALDGDAGYLVRIAVHPALNSRGIGTRLMAEAIHFFRQSRVQRIMLNTQADNTHAHRLYEWFGFMRIPQVGFVLRKYL